jgi:hypothetical protein
VGAAKVDVRASIAKLARRAATRGPRVVCGEGQGARAAAAFARPHCLEQAMISLNVQVQEAHSVGQAWGNVALVLVSDSHVSKKGVQQDKLKEAIPELFASKFPIAPRPTLAVRNPKCIHYDDAKKLLAATNVAVADLIQDVELETYLAQPLLLMWGHSGKCSCGRRAFLYARCPKCLLEEAVDDELARRDLRLDLDVQEPAFDVGATGTEVIDGTERFKIPNAMVRVPECAGFVFFCHHPLRPRRVRQAAPYAQV